MKVSTKYLVIVSMTGLWAGGTRPAEQAKSERTDVLLIDPLLIAQAAEVWSLVARQDNPVWPGWDASSTPLLLYLPGEQDVLIDHPNPPEGFVRYTGPVAFGGRAIYVKNGTTLIDFDGQNTSRDINRIETLVVADTLSNRKMDVVGMLQDPRPAGEKLDQLRYEALRSDPYETMGLIAHEAFHVYQFRKAPDKAANEMALLHYPTLSVDNNVGFALEGKALTDALRADGDRRIRRAALRWLALRKDRRDNLNDEDIAYEDGTEFNEGLAKYIEYRLTQTLEDRTPGTAMKWVQGFRGYDNLSALRARMIEMMLRHMRGEVNVNNDPYGAAPLRMRFYWSGMAIGALLDRLGAEWKSRILEPGTTLTGLVESALTPTSDELREALAVAKTDPERASLTRAKSKLQAEGRRWARAQMAEILEGPNTGLLIDYSRLGEPSIGFSFTPFGIVAVDEQRTIYRMVPIAGRIGPATFRQTRPSPLLHDKQHKRIMLRLADEVTPEVLARALGFGALPDHSVTVDSEFELPGVVLRIGRATVSFAERTIVIALEPAQ